MSHALIIDDDPMVSRIVQDRLSPLGFGSFEQACSEEQAVRAAARRLPDLVVVGDAVRSGSAIEAARRIASMHAVPVLLVTGNSERTRANLPDHARLDGPFALDDMADAVRSSGGRTDDRRDPTPLG